MLSFEKTHNEIVAPLVKIKEKLYSYIEKQKYKVIELKVNKDEIDKSIFNSEHEILKSNHTANKISELLDINFKDDEKFDVISPVDETESNILGE